jgi:glycoside/pentoside/hexuronide:cation symporter, GPH family
MKDYDVDETKALEVRDLIAKRKAPKGSGSGTKSVFSELNIAGWSKAKLLKEFPYYINTGLRFENLSLENVKKNFNESFSNKMHGICFSAYTENQNPGDSITEEQIVKRLSILKNHTKWVRVFSCTNGHEKIPAIAKEMGFNVLMGAWIGKENSENEKEIEALINLINEGHVDMAAVGNEVMFRGDQQEDTIIKYIQQVKTKTTGVPVCTVDIYNEFISRPNLVKASDKILINCYPFWEGASIEQAGIYLQEMYRKTEAIANGKEIIITETGWPSAGEVVENAQPSMQNQMAYFVEVQSWAAEVNVDLFYFSSFDESWKIHYEGWAGTAWGLWTSQEEFKFK